MTLNMVKSVKGMNFSILAAFDVYPFSMGNECCLQSLPKTMPPFLKSLSVWQQLAFLYRSLLFWVGLDDYLVGLYQFQNQNLLSTECFNDSPYCSADLGIFFWSSMYCTCETSCFLSIFSSQLSFPTRLTGAAMNLWCYDVIFS